MVMLSDVDFFSLDWPAEKKSCHARISLGSKFPRVTCYLLQIRRAHTTEAKLKANQKQGTKNPG